MDVQRIIDTFELLPDWNQRYEFITELGHKLATLPEAYKTDQNLVQGCTTRTWVTGHLGAGEPAVMEYLADAEGALVRGIVALLLTPFQDKTPQEVLAEDPRDFIGKLGLEQHLSPNRRAGMYAFIAKVKAIARECSNGA
jgi:cysteine desulfuration protein SufE